MNTETTPLGQYLLRRQAASQHYVGSSAYEPPIGCEQSAFLAGWDAAVEEIGLMIQTPGADGRFCTHHDDDPAHGQDCYSLVEYLTQYMERGASLDAAQVKGVKPDNPEIAGSSPASIPTALNELERIANATRRGGELAAYKIALDDVRAMMATNLSEGIGHLDNNETREVHGPPKR